MQQGKSALGIVQKYYPWITAVVDAKRSLDIVVSKADCRTGKTKAADQCAMAKACEKEHDGAIISLSVAYIIDGTKATRYKVPTSVAREIVSFDRFGGFSPGVYNLAAPTKIQRLGKRTGPQSKAKGNYGKVKKRHHRTAGIRSL